MSNQIMRLIVFFDLPVTKKEERQVATKFRNYLISDGFYMIQFSVYGRLCSTIENANLHVNKMKNYLPFKGSVRGLLVTEKQYSKMMVLLGHKKRKEKGILENQLSIF